MKKEIWLTYTEKGGARLRLRLPDDMDDEAARAAALEYFRTGEAPDGVEVEGEEYGLNPEILSVEVTEVE